MHAGTRPSSASIAFFLSNRVHLNSDRSKTVFTRRAITGYQWKLSVLSNEMRHFLFQVHAECSLYLALAFDRPVEICVSNRNEIVFRVAKISCKL